MTELATSIQWYKKEIDKFSKRYNNMNARDKERDMELVCLGVIKEFCDKLELLYYQLNLLKTE